MEVRGCVSLQCLSRDPPCRRRRRFPQVPAPGQSCNTAPRRLNSWRWGSEGKAALPAWKKWQSRECSLFTISSSKISSFCRSCSSFQLSTLPLDTSWTCHSLNMLNSTSSQELPPKPQPVAELRALVRVKGRLRCDDAVLQTGEHVAHIQNHSKCLLRSHPQANSFCLWWECLHFLPLSAFWHIKEMAGIEIPGDPLVLFLWMLVPRVYLKKDDSFNCLSLWLCVSLPIVRRRVLFAIMDWLGLILGEI